MFFLHALLPVARVNAARTIRGDAGAGGWSISPFLFALWPLRRFADFQGRSTRTELCLFHLSAQMLSVAVIMFAGIFTRSFDVLAGDLVYLVLLCPILALWTRRLHDSGRSGYWLLLVLPGGAVGLWRHYALWLDPLAFAGSDLSTYFNLATGLLLLPFMILLFADDQEGINAYGPNPRYREDISRSDPPGEPA